MSRTADDTGESINRELFFTYFEPMKVITAIVRVSRVARVGDS